MRQLKKQSKSSKPIKRFVGSDNVFRDLGFPEDEAVNLLARSTLMIEIKKIIESSGLTQAEAAKIAGVRQPRVSALFTGNIEAFTVDMLMKWLARLGKEVIITVRNKNEVA